MKAWVVVGVLLVAPLATRAQSVRDYQVIPAVSSVVVWDDVMIFNLSHMSPGAAFREWWAEVEECTDTRKPFGDIDWYIASAMVKTDGSRFAGLYNTSTPEIILVNFMNDESLRMFTKHEILHHLGFHHGSDVYERCV